MTALELYNKLKKVDIDAIVIDCIDATVGEILQYNLQQLLDGKTSEGVDISPGYLDDPYFKTREAAEQYSKWKETISPRSKRTPGVPNLYINGAFHASIRVRVEGDKLVTSSNYKDAVDIERKYPTIYGLSPESRELFIAHVFFPLFRMKMEVATGLKFSP